MKTYQREFIEFALARKALCFGDFTLKSGRRSPYFFNSGLFSSGGDLLRIGQFYAGAIRSTGIEFDMLFGPAYKGIPLATAVAVALAQASGRDLPVCFNRKETKDHGEGGETFGAAPRGRVLIIDDVISAGTSVTGAIGLITRAGATPAAVAVALDRMERGSGRESAAAEMEARHGIKVVSIVTLTDLVDYLDSQPDMAGSLAIIRQYREQYGA